METSRSQLDVLIKNLCVVVHTELEHLEDDFIPKASISDLLSQDSFKALHYISSVIEKTLEAKLKSKEDPLYEEFLKDELYQREMQKLEHEIRNHIKTEQQMKLYADALEEKSEKIAAKLKDLKESSPQNDEQLAQENKRLKSKISMVQKEIQDLKGPENLLRPSSKGKGLNKHTEINKKIAKVDYEHAQMTKSLQEAEKEYTQQKKDNDELKFILKDFLSLDGHKDQALFYKKKFEEKCLELDQLKKKLRVLELNKRNRSSTPTLSKNINVQSQRQIKKNGSAERLRNKVEKFGIRADPTEKKRLPLSFTSRK